MRYADGGGAFLGEIKETVYFLVSYDSGTHLDFIAI